jgi:hypothetical protein
MTTRIKLETVTFASPFRLESVEGTNPPGTFTIETIEELVGGLTTTGWRRVSTTIELLVAGAIQRHPIQPAELEANRMKATSE